MLTLSHLLAFRREHNCPLIVDDLTEGETSLGYNVSIRSEGHQHTCYVTAGTAEATTLEALLPFANAPVAQEEFRFTTHDFCDPASWDGRTNGDPAASWAAANGGVTYDDVGYRWLDENGDPVCYLDAVEGGIGSLWKNSANDLVIVEYNVTTKHWERIDNDDNVTSSRWSIIPYPNTKMELIMANVIFGADAVIQPTGTLRYTVHMYLPENYAGPGAPAGVYPVKQFVYPSAYLMRLSADSHKDIGQDVFANYDYRTTVKPVFDANAGMKLELTLDNHVPVVSVTGRPAIAVFIGKKIASF
jgi:hypothetical protein